MHTCSMPTIGTYWLDVGILVLYSRIILWISDYHGVSNNHHPASVLVGIGKSSL